MEKQKTALVEALARKGCILAEIFLARLRGSVQVDEAENTLPTPTITEIDNVMKDILKFTDYTDTKVNHHMQNFNTPQTLQVFFLNFGN